MIDDRDRLARTDVHDAALACVEAGIEAAHPKNAIRESIRLDGDVLEVHWQSGGDGGVDAYDLTRYDEVVVLGGGKAAGAIAVELERILGERLTRGAVVVPEPVDELETDRVEVFLGGHPLPDDGSVEGARRLLELAGSADERTLVLAVVTGGGSAMLAAPAEGVELDDLQSVTEALLDAGVDIDGINAVRKHCSAIKGGQLARAAAPATVAGLLVSDVVGDDPGVIASGPTAPDETTFRDAVDVLDRHGVDAPEAVRDRLEAGARGELPETPRADDPAFERVRNRVLLNAWTAIEAARTVAADRGFQPCVLSSRMRGEARESALAHVAIGEEVAATGNPLGAPAALFSGGELTVTVRGEGVGGPSLEFALRAALELADSTALPENAVAACVDTDGRDGSTDAAGAIVDAGTVEEPREARRSLAENDAYGYLGERGALVVTGGTGTNVNDLRVLLVPE